MTGDIRLNRLFQINLFLPIRLSRSPFKAKRHKQPVFCPRHSH
nr:MAG TPA_asm: hypothetical protein [Caudoviricetes sp.]